MKRKNIEGGLTFDDGYRADPALETRRAVAYRRQARAYDRIRSKIDRRYLSSPRYADGVEVVLELPHRLSGWREPHKSAVLKFYPELADLIKQIDALRTERALMKSDPTYGPPHSTYKRVPWPSTDPAERLAEANRRAVASMRALRQKRKAEAMGQPNLDLIQKL